MKPLPVVSMGVIDDVMFFDRALSASDVYALYLTYGESETRSITEDQAFLDAMIEKLGSSLPLKRKHRMLSI